MKTYIISILIAMFTLLGLHSQQSINSSGGDGTGNGSVSYSLGQLVVNTEYGVSDQSLIFQGVQIPFEEYGDGIDCSSFDTAPVDLNKSFNPVNGVQDRVQVKWYKDSPQVRYTVEDNAACDIQYWAYRYKNDPVDPWINIPLVDRDTLQLPYTTVKKNNGNELFKWPIKYRLNNGTNQVLPNHGYRWRVRCYCDQGALINGSQVISPWSQVKFFNTPDFDPSTGIFTPPAGQEDLSSSKILSDEQMDIQVFPNPNDGNFRIVFDTELELGEILLTLRDIQGKLIEQRIVQLGKANSDILWNSPVVLEKGVYLMEIRTEQYQSTKRVMIDR